MRIAQIAPLAERCPPLLYGGTERVVSYLTEALVGLGHDVTLFASGDSVTSANLVPCTARAVRLDDQVKDPLPYFMMMMDEVSRRAAEFDVLHFHIDIMHAPLVRPYMNRTLTTLHGRLDLPDLAPFYEHFSDLPVVSISHSQREPLPHANWVGTVHHGLRRDLLPFSAKRDGYLAFIGRISPEKRPDRAIEIAARCGLPLKIAAKVDKADAIYWRDVIEPMVRAHSNVEYIGEIDETQKGEFLGNARALLFPIDWEEPFGLVMIEAMACGTPVIAFRRGSVPEVIDNGLSGYIVDDVDAAVRAVGQLDALDRRRVRATFEQRFTVERMAHDYLELYRARAASHRHRPAERPQLTAVSLRA
jgi:glycosyltransferase involved in cell wall biosynthesis